MQCSRVESKMANVKPQSAGGHTYKMVRKVAWDMLWHLCWQDNSGEWHWDRVDKETALNVAGRI